MKRSHNFGIGSALKTTYSQRIFTPTPKNVVWEKASNLYQSRQSEARNFKTAQRIDKRLSHVSSRINALQKGTKLGAITPRGFSAT